nr:MAG TPA: hypothetical protein [Caudoviricetes sp.]
MHHMVVIHRVNHILHIMMLTLDSQMLRCM